MADWYVYQHDGDYLGPWPTETVADAIMNGKLGADVWVAAPGGERWVRATDIPVIARLIEGAPTRKRRDSGLRLMPNARAMSAQARTQEDVDSAAQTLKMPTMRHADDEPPTDPNMPPVTPTPSPPSPPPHVGAGVTLESTGNRRRRRNG